MAVFLIGWAGYYPGGLYGDQLGQYSQAVNNSYEDWHPAIHTLLFYRLPLTLSFGWFGSIVLFQMILFGIAITYAAYTLLTYTNRIAAFGFLAFVLLNPSTAVMALQPFKDTAFAIGTLFLTAFAFHIVCTQGSWLKKSGHIAMLVSVLSLTTLFRHNALLFTVPYGIATAFYMSKKRTAVTLASVILVIFLIKIPVYSLFGVSDAGKRQSEMLGLPMNVIGAVVSNSPDSLDSEVLDFAYRVAPQEVWQEKYEYGDFNAVKWDSRTKTSVIEEFGAGKVLSYTLKAFKANPAQAVLGFIKTTDTVYSVTDDYSYYEAVSVADNDFGIRQSGIGFIRNILNRYKGAAMMLLPHLFMYVGSMMLVLILSLLAKCRFNKWVDWKKMFFALPVLFYNFGTMLLLTGAADSARFFYYTFLTVPLLAILFFTDNTTNTVP